MEKITKEQLAATLNGRYKHNELTKEEGLLALQSGLVVVFAYSDDNMELRGAINDEVGCYDGGIAYLNKNGLLVNECEDEDCPYFEERKVQATSIAAIWDEEHETLWRYETTIPHATFDIMDEDMVDEIYCRGIVFSLDDVR